MLGSSSRVILFDANVLLVLMVGRWKRERVGTFKRTRPFTVSDYDLLLQILARFGRLVTTSHILTEVSNLAGGHNDPERTEFFRSLATTIPLLAEKQITSAGVAATPVFTRLGLTDAAIIQLAETEALHVLTTDLDLFGEMLRRRLNAHNFNWIRDGATGLP